MSRMHFRISGLTILLAAFVCGCEMASVEVPEPPSGGREYVLDYDVFAAEIDTILTAHGCDNLSCHGGGIRGTFELSPAGDKDVRMDFRQAGYQVDADDPAASRLLMKPLDEDAVGTAHTAQSGGWTSTSDRDYQTILAWIEAGVYR
jgi:hypothetical protein